MNSWDCFLEISLPPISVFYSKLNDKGITKEDYSHGQTVWREFSIRNMGEYHNLCLLRDTLLLANVFNEYRSVRLDNYGLDPLHFFTAPGLSWQALLKSTLVRSQHALDVRTWN